MADRSLAGRKIAVLVESQYIAAEIKCYQERFAGYGAEVHLLSHLGGQPKQTFVSEVEETGKTPETLDVGIDFTQVNLDDWLRDPPGNIIQITTGYTDQENPPPPPLPPA